MNENKIKKLLGTIFNSKLYVFPSSFLIVEGVRAAQKDEVESFVKQGVKARLTGVATLKTWLQNHPDTGHLIAGEVKVWSSNLSHLTQTQITPTIKTKKITAAPKTKIEPKNHSRSSANFNDEASF